MMARQSLAKLLRELRAQKGLSLRDVERATDDYVSNAYLSQLELGKRLEPNPKYLLALAKVYEVPAEVLFESAGYAEGPAPSEVDIAFQQVLADKNFQFGTRFKGNLDESSKRVIIELYEGATNKKLLGKERDDSEQGSSKRRRR